jgi:hypothetical protein
MRKRTIDLQFEKPLLDVVSYGRAHRPLTQAQRTFVARTVRRVPEVVVKVSGGARTLGGVQAHWRNIGRDGVLWVELDDGTHLAGDDFQKAIVLDWDLDMDIHGQPNVRSVRGRREPPKLVHNIIFSSGNAAGQIGEGCSRPDRELVRVEAGELASADRRSRLATKAGRN